MKIGEISLVLIAELQVVLGAVGCCLALAGLAGVDLPIEIPWTLALAVAAIYAADRWLDAHHLDVTAPSARHRMAQEHPQVVAVWILLLAIAGAFLAWRLPTPVRNAGLILAGALGIYLIALARHPRMAVFKEPLVAAGYVAGVALGPVALGAGRELYPALAGLLLAAFANLMIFASKDIEVDRHLGVASLASWLGPGRSDRLIVILILAMAILAATGLTTPIWRFGSTLLAIMAVCLEIARRLPRAEGARLLADAVFLLPAALLFVDG